MRLSRPPALLKRLDISSRQRRSFSLSHSTHFRGGALHVVCKLRCRFAHQQFSTLNTDKLMTAEMDHVSKVPTRSKENAASSNSAGPVVRNIMPNVQASLEAMNPVDLYRDHISEALEPITGVPATEIKSKLQWTQTQDKGDLMLPVPALRIKGKPIEQANEWTEKVCTLSMKRI